MTTAEADFYGDMGPILDGDMAAFVREDDRHRSLTVVREEGDVDVIGETRRWMDKIRADAGDVDGCTAMRRAVERHADGSRKGQLDGALAVVRLDERGHRGLGAALDQLWQVRAKDGRDFRRLVEWARGRVITNPSPPADIGCRCGGPTNPEDIVADDVRERLEQASPKSPKPHHDGGFGDIEDASPKRSRDAEPPLRRLVSTPASKVAMRRLRWLWNLRIVLGGLTLLAGREGIGKSTVAAWLAALVTRGQLAGELHGEPRTVIYVNSEDARDYTIVPRLVAAGADLDRVHFVDAVMPGVDGEEFTESIVLPRDADLLADLARDEKAALVILDAATSVIDSKLDGDKDRQMRQGLEAIGRVVGEGTSAAVLGIVHFGKRDSADTGKLILGSIAWSQVARSVLAVATWEEKDEVTGEKIQMTNQLVISRTKGNLGAEPPHIAARIVSSTVSTPEGDTDVGRVELIGETEIDARDLLSGGLGREEEREEERDALGEAVAWLTDRLKEGEHESAGVLLKAAKTDGIAERTLKRARQKAGVVTRKEGASWVWSREGANTPDAVTSEDAKGPTNTHVHVSWPLGPLAPSEASLCSRCGREPAIPSDPLGKCRTCNYGPEDRENADTA